MKKTALVVEDNALNCALFLEILRHAGFATICDTTGGEAQRLAESVRPAVALVDLQLPEASGLDVIRDLRAKPVTSGIPVIAVSAFARSADGLAALKAGADLFFCKPVDPRRLTAAVEKLVAEADAGMEANVA
ncbi:MAG: response regulator [Pseudomonadota bacterium]